MKNLKFGIEIETTGLARPDAARIMAKVLGTTQTGHLSSYDTYYAVDSQGRRWKAVSDASVTGAHGGAMAEIVSPICTYDDIETVQAIARALKAAGARTDHTCGIHIHVGAEGFDADGLARLAKTVCAKEDLMAQSFGISAERLEQWCRPVDPDFMHRLLRMRKHSTLEDFARVWYDSRNWELHADEHYDQSRYHMLNLHATFQKGEIWGGHIERLGTIEYRAFNGTLHAGKIKAYIQFCLALTAAAKASKSASPRKNPTDNPKYAMRCWLLRLGLIGEEFATCRKHLTDSLPGDCAFRHGRPGHQAA